MAISLCIARLGGNVINNTIAEMISFLIFLVLSLAVGVITAIVLLGGSIEIRIGNKRTKP